MYGKFGLSSIIGKRSVPTTRSISSRAFLKTSGCSTIAKRNVCRTAFVWSQELVDFGSVSP